MRHFVQILWFTWFPIGFPVSSVNDSESRREEEKQMLVLILLKKSCFA